MPSANSGIVRGYCRHRDNCAAIKAAGVDDKALYLEGRGAETLEQCIASFRGRPGRLLIAPDLRVFGAAKKDVAEVMARLERAHIRVEDIAHPEDGTIAEMMQRASVLISGTRFRDRRTARRRGREGGLAKGESLVQARAQIAPDWLLRNIVAEEALSWPAKLRLLDGRISEATLRRHYREAA